MSPVVLEDTALLVTRSRELAVGLAALLLSVPPIRHVERATARDALLDRLRGSKPGLVVLDTEAVGPDVSGVVQAIHAISPTTRYVILGNTVQEVREANEYAADKMGAAIVKGTDPKGLTATIERLLVAQQGTEGR